MILTEVEDRSFHSCTSRLCNAVMGNGELTLCIHIHIHSTSHYSYVLYIFFALLCDV